MLRRSIPALRQQRLASARPARRLPLPLAFVVALLPPLLFLGFVLLRPAPAQGAAEPTFTVNSTLDEPEPAGGIADGVCQATPSGKCTLRAAIQQAEYFGAATIILPSGSYVLIQGQLDIKVAITIQGAGPGQTIIDGNGDNPACYPATTLSCRIFDMQTGSSLTAADLTVRNGKAGIGEAGHYHGGAIHNHGTLTLTNVVISESAVVQPGWGGGGLTTAGGATAALERVTVSGNSAQQNGGGIENLGGLSLINATVSGNSTTGQGGGIWHSGAAFSALNAVTIAGNSAAANGGGGINRGGGATLYVSKTLLAGNTGGNCAGTPTSFDQGWNVSSDGSCPFAQAGDRNATDPQLGPLHDNGGGLPTHMPAPTSAAVDLIPTPCGGVDQRGVSRPQGAGCDSGAVEYTPTSPSPSPSASPSASPSPSPSTGPAPSFADVPPGYWAHDQIVSFAQRGITTGCGDNDQGQRLYCPERGVTRAEMATFLTRALGQDTQAPPATPTFADVPADYWAYGQIEAFVQLGITTGCGTDDLGRRVFCPDRGVTRAEMAAFLDRAKNQTELKPGTPTFADVPPGYWAYGWIERFFTLGVTTGCGEDEQGRKVYCPDRGVTRAEMAVFIIRAYP